MLDHRPLLPATSGAWNRRDGGEGPECGVCKRGYFLSSTSNTCELCNEAGSATLPVIMTFGVIIALALIVWLLLSPAVLQRCLPPSAVTRSRNIVNWCRQILGSATFTAQGKVVWTALQILAECSWTMDYVPFPDVYSKFIGRLSGIILFDISAAIPSACLHPNTNEHYRLLGQTLGPWVVAVLLFLLYRFKVCVWPSLRERHRHDFTNRVIFMAFILLPSTYVALRWSISRSPCLTSADVRAPQIKCPLRHVRLQRLPTAWTLPPE